MFLAMHTIPTREFMVEDEANPGRYFALGLPQSAGEGCFHLFYADDDPELLPFPHVECTCGECDVDGVRDAEEAVESMIGVLLGRGHWN